MFPFTYGFKEWGLKRGYKDRVMHQLAAANIKVNGSSFQCKIIFLNS